MSKLKFHIPKLFLKRKRLFIGLLMLLVIIPIVFLTLKYARPTIAAWWDETWGYRQRVDITNSGSAQTDYQVAITLDTAALITAGKMQTNCNDIRITNANKKVLPIWIETNGLKACNQTTTKIWVKMPSVLTSGNTLYIYYGNPSAPSVSNGNTVFIFFDDFNNASIDSTKWTVTGSEMSISSGRLRAERANGTGNIYATSTFARPFTLDMDYYPTQYPSGWEGGYHGSISFGTYNTSNANEHTWVPHGGLYESSVLSYDGLCDDGGCYHGNAVWDLRTGNVQYNISMKVQPLISGPQGVMTYTNVPDDGTGGSASDTVYTAATTGNDPLKIGVADYGNNTSDDFEWDNWRVRKYAATEPSVASPTNEEKSQAPVAYWKFDEGYGTTINNSAANTTFTGSLSGPTWASEDQCISGKCLNYSAAAAQTTTISNNITAGWTANNDFTLSMWFNCKGEGYSDPPYSYLAGLFIHGNSAENGTGGFFLRQLSTSCASVQFNVGTTTAQNSISANLSSGQNNWSHLVAVKSGDTLSFYENGVQKATQTFTGASWYVNVNEPTQIGYVHGRSIKGFIDDVKVYSYARTAAQIKSDYTSRGSIKGVSVQEGSNIKNNDAFSNGLVGYWKMDETASPSVDSSGNGNGGTWNGNVTSAPGKFGNGTIYDGSADYLTISNNNVINVSQGTVSLWVKPNSGSTANYFIFSHPQTATNSRIYINTNAAGTVIEGLLGNGTLIGSANITASTWHHVILSWNGTQAKFYLDGADSTTTGTFNGLTDTAATLYLGSFYGGESLNGTIDEVRIYNRALTPSEVEGLYQWAPGPMGYWNFDEKTGTTANDTSGNNKSLTIYNSPAWTQGKVGSALEYNGSSQYARRTGDTDINRTNGQELTVSVWIYPKRLAGQYQDLVVNRSASLYNWMLYQHTDDGSIQLHGSAQYKSTYIPPLNTWTHIEATVDSSGYYRLYANGILVQGPISYTYNLSSPSELSIGNFGTTEYYQGKIDDVKIYNYARNSKQIAEDMNAGHSAVGSTTPVGYWKFDEGYGTTANNTGSQGSLLNLTLAGSTATPTWENNAKFNKGLRFDGTDDYTSNSFDLGVLKNGNETGSFTLSAWVKPDGTQAGPERVIAGRAGCHSGLVANADNSFGFNLAATDCWTNGRMLSSGTISNWNNWHHVVGVYENRSMKIYVDSVLKNSTTFGASIYAHGNTFYVGAIGTYAVDGTIDEVKIYNSALTTDQVYQDYNNGLSMKLGSISTDSSGNPQNSSSSKYCIPGDPASCNAPVGEWKMDEKSTSSAYDTSGNNSILTATGITSSDIVPGKIGSAYYYHTWPQYHTGASVNICGTSTMEAWVYPLSSPSERYTVIIQNGTSPQYLSINSDNSVNAYWYGKSVEGYHSSGAGTVPNKTWTHIATTWDANGVNLYVNGVLKNSVASTGTPCTGTNLIIGAENSGRQMNGYIDQAKIYDYARTPAQVAHDYNRGGPVGQWKFDECQGTVANDSSGKGNNGTIMIGGTAPQTSAGTCTTSGTAWGNGAAGKFSPSLNLDGADDYVTITDPPGGELDFGTGDVSMSAWIKHSASLGSSWDAAIFSKWGASAGYFFSVRTNSDPTNAGKLNFGIRDNGTTWAEGKSNSTVNDNIWHHVVVVADRSTSATFYIDGKPNGSFDISGQPGSLDNSVNPTIGLLNSYFNGQIDDVRVYNYPLTPTQIKTIYNNGAVNYGPATGTP